MKVKTKSSGPWQGPELKNNTKDYEHNVTTVSQNGQGSQVDEPFSGKYRSNRKHTCQTTARILSDGVRVVTQRRTARLWRDRPNTNSKRCEACYHERVWRFCKQIEQYRPEDLVYSVLPDKKAHKRLVDKLNKRTQRGHPRANYAAFPQDDGTYIWIHDQGHIIYGEPIPTNRKTLYSLLYDWADTPQGDEFSCSKEWGGDYRGTKGNYKRKVLGEITTEISVASFDELNDAFIEEGIFGWERYNLTEERIVRMLVRRNVRYGIVKGHDRVDEIRSSLAIPMQTPVPSYVGVQ